ncbi:hypothetical protein A2U01_0099750, partial [Trifolium medium]|nr:hypothetical protein [Trifolium medium]
MYRSVSTYRQCIGAYRRIDTYR